MNTDTGVLAAFALLVVVLAYSYLRLRDSKLRKAGATPEQLHARSLMTVQNVRGGWAGIIGVFLLLAGVWLPIEKHLNLEPTPWFESGLLIVFGVCLLAGSALLLSRAVSLKKLSKGKVGD